ncbi:acetate kinase [Thiohalocapsa marina]|uniref:Acetate kinase n=1 Tax=Thiohalocapsa marina TaxID=424902 RepID=A0A5M8FIU5_9GAMM|nr:acetate kinase [Thiohalocapsa marina]KAA6184404.1 acetate kinase [Thiohalocapsa marina]
MSKILVINSGSSSIKYKLYDRDDWRVLASGSVMRIGEPASEIHSEWLDGRGEHYSSRSTTPIATHADGMDRILLALAGQLINTPPPHEMTEEEIDHLLQALKDGEALAEAAELAAVGHRVVHGGEAFHLPTLVDDDVIEAIRHMSPLAPLHNPANLDGILVARELFPGIPHVAVFDTAFHQTMPRTAYRYAIPDYLYREHWVRRYGFHGTSHHYVAKRAAHMLGKPLEQCNLITLHLGNGASATAIRDGASVDTSMGMTPLEGLVMGTRCGDLDPAIHFYLSKHLGLDNDTLDDLLNRQSGLLGLCGVNDMREIQRKAQQGDEAAELAIGVTCHRLKKYIGAYYAELGRVDAIVFTGGIGENDAETRARSCAGLERLGIELDPQANTRPHDQLTDLERDIATAASPVRLLVIPTDEELEIARQAFEAVAGADGSSSVSS